MIVMPCGKCGAPFLLRSLARWNDNGTLAFRFSKDTNLCIIEADAFRGMLDGISADIGYPIDHIVMQATRNLTRLLTGQILSSGHGVASLLGEKLSGSRMMVKVLRTVYWWAGYGNVEVLEYEKGQRMYIRCDDPAVVPIVVGAIWGIFEFIDGTTAEVDWEMSKDTSLFVEARAVKEEIVEEYPGRLVIGKPVTIQTGAAQERCPRCGVSSEYTRTIRWDYDRGTMTNWKTGAREFVIEHGSVTAIVDELTNELGDQVPGIVESTQREYFAGILAEKPLPNIEGQYRELLSQITWRGLGRASEVTKAGDHLRVRIDNPFCEPMLAGRVGGYYQALEGKAPSIHWSSSDVGVMTIEITPEQREPSNH